MNNSLSTTPLVTIADAHCRIGEQKTLRIDNFELRTGQHWCVFGPNGAGKTLLANLIAYRRLESQRHVHCREGFVPERDVFLVSFEEQQRLWERDNRLDISEFSENAEDQGTTVIELIRSARPNKTCADAQLNVAEPELQEMLDQLGLMPFAQRGIRYLSSGQIRKVLIARALYAKTQGQPKVLILDDPLESIDVDSQHKIRAAIERWMDDGNATLLLCRRERDIFPALTHMLLMEDLAISEQGDRLTVLASAGFEKLRERVLSSTDLSLTLPVKREAVDAATNSQLAENLPLIELVDVDASYREHAVLRGVTWVMNAANHVLIEGPNGCGKSTLLSLIDGDNHKAYGQNVTLFGRRRGSGETVWEVKSHFGIVSNELHNKYVKGWKVLDVVVSGFFDSVGLYDDSGASEHRIARDWLMALGIEHLAKNYYHELSFGQQRLVLLARAMVKHPRILILDEPCVGLDDFHRKTILAVLDQIARECHTQLIYVSHVQDEKPTCINQRLRFVAVKGGGYRLDVSEEYRASVQQDSALSENPA